MFGGLKMTALNFLIQKNQIYIVMDTLAISGDDKTPYMFKTKFLALPHINTVICGTGNGPFVENWFAMAQHRMVVKDLDNLDFHTTTALLEIKKEYEDLDKNSVTLYHFGYSRDRERYLCYVYRSTNDFESEEILDGFGIKPQIDVNLNGERKLPEKFIEIVKQQRVVDNSSPIASKVGIGGDVIFIHLQNNSITILPCYRFDDYNDNFSLMCKKLRT